MHDQSTETTLVCHARTPLVLDPVESRIERARACERTDLVDRVVVRSWPDTVRLDDGGPHREVLEEYRRFEAWAERRGVSVSPPFETRTRSSIVEDDGVEVLVTPVLSLAVYRDQRLVAVFPHTDGDETYSVEDALERLEADQLPRPLEAAPDFSNSRDCPDCGGDLVNGQGLFICPDCAWTGTLSREGWSELEAVELGPRGGPGAEPEPGTGSEAEPASGPAPESEPELVAGSASGPDAVSEPDAASELDAASEPDGASGSDAESETDAEPESDGESETEHERGPVPEH